MGLTKEEIDRLLAKKREKERGKTPHQHTEYRSQQKGPLRWYEHSMPCSNHAGYRGGGCGSPTYCRVEGAPLCMMHALRRLNELVLEMDKNAQARIFQREQQSPSIYEEAIRRQEGDTSILRNSEQTREGENTSSQSQLGLF